MGKIGCPVCTLSFTLHLLTGLKMEKMQRNLKKLNRLIIAVVIFLILALIILLKISL